jgi:hypothetical protein
VEHNRADELHEDIPLVSWKRNEGIINCVIAENVERNHEAADDLEEPDNQGLV